MSHFDGDFRKFTESGCDRAAFIGRFFDGRGIESFAMPVKGRNHIYVKFPSGGYNPMFRIKTVIAHYDRVSGSPGANDNSAAVFRMMQWAAELASGSDFHNVRLLFTDGEELSENGVSSQGSYNLAVLFRKLGIVNDDVFVFDCMGRGTVPIICDVRIPRNAGAKFRRDYAFLERRAEKILSEASPGRWLKLPSSMSDNAGFLANGIPAVAFTMLPAAEAETYLNSIVRGDGTDIPRTWRLIHTSGDDVDSLDPEAFVMTGRILDALARQKTPAVNII